LSSLPTMTEFGPIELSDETLDSQDFSASDFDQQDCRSDIRSKRPSDHRPSTHRQTDCVSYTAPPEENSFLDLYAAFSGTEDVDQFSWCTQSFKDPENS
jgi:hypothetical protein